MENADIIKQLLIRRYSKLSNVKEEKIRAKLDNNSIDVIIEKHNNTTNRLQQKNYINETDYFIFDGFRCRCCF